MSKYPPKKSEPVYIPKPKLNFSQFQKDIFRDISKGEGHTIIEARAGAGKTSTIIESFRYVPKGKKILALAFNKIIQEELRARSPSYVDVFTFHSFALRAIKQRFGAVEIDDNKVFDIVRGQLDSNVDIDLINSICDTVAYCKYSLDDSPSYIDDLIDRFGIDTSGLDRRQFISLVIKTLGIDKTNTAKIDFNDMCYYAFAYNLPLGQYSFVFSDEYQDLNKSNMFIAKKACTPGGRIIAVGDPLQNIYSWRLSDDSIINEIKKQPSTKILPLPISYRCPKSVIELAQFWVPDITCPSSAINGEINEIHLNELYSKAKVGSFVLSRTNAPLIKICLGFIRNNVKANIKGRDVANHLLYLIKKSKKKQVPAFLSWLQDWKDEEVARLKAKGFNIENTLDKYECLVNLCDECKTLEEVKKVITDLFNETDEKNIVILSTVHRAKGLERDDVFILRWTFSLWLDENALEIEKPNESMNVAYVAATRAKKRLFIVRK